MFELIESRISLQDSLLQLFSEPEELKLINVDLTSELKITLPPEHDSHFTYWLTLGKKVSVESRVVTSFPALFGDIVGLRDFFNFIITLLIGSMQTRIFKYDMLSSLFSVGKDMETQP